MANKINFSEKALNNLNSNTGSQTLSGAKNYWSYFLLTAITLLFAILLLWGFCGSMSESISGTGIVLLNKGTRPVVAYGTGTLSHLNISVGTEVSPGQPLGQIHNALVPFGWATFSKNLCKRLCLKKTFRNA